MAAANNQWEEVQKKTFTKWCNNHLSKAWGGERKIKDILTDWEDGIMLIYLSVALYKENDKEPEKAISLPKLKPAELNPKARIQKVTNNNTALSLLKQAGVKLTVSSENLVDHDKVSILGMVWMIILDYASRGFGGSPAEVKRALLEWVNRKTEGYERVNPPGVTNFSGDWRSGLAWCALIHRHRPELLDYQKCLGQSNAENLELAFTVAERELNIPRLLDVEDVDVDKPDEKSVLTYVMEYFNAFAGEALREAAAKQAADWLAFIRAIKARQNQYEKRAAALLKWIADTQGGWKNYNFGHTSQDAEEAFNSLRSFVGKEKPPKECEKMDCEALFAEIQTTLNVNGLQPYVPPAHLSVEKLSSALDELNHAQSRHGAAVRQNKFRFIEKKEDHSAAEVAEQISRSFKNYDKNGNGVLNKTEFHAATMEMGIVLKTEKEQDDFFRKIAGDDAESVSFEAYRSWMTSRLVVKMDSPESVKAAFNTIAGGRQGLTDSHLRTPPLTADDYAFLAAEMPRDGDGNYDYSALWTR